MSQNPFHTGEFFFAFGNLFFKDDGYLGVTMWPTSGCKRCERSGRPIGEYRKKINVIILYFLLHRLVKNRSLGVFKK